MSARIRNTHNFVNFMNRLSSGDRARLRSCAGPNTGRCLSAIPSEKQLELEGSTFLCAIFRRLGLPVSTDVFFFLCTHCKMITMIHNTIRSRWLLTGDVLETVGARTGSYPLEHKTRKTRQLFEPMFRSQMDRHS